MDSYLHIILLVVASAIILFIVLEALHRRRKAKEQKSFASSLNNAFSMNPDEVLGLEEKEPVIKINARGHETYISAKSQIDKTSRFSYASRDTGHEFKTSSKPANILNDLLAITVVPQDGGQFESYDLLQAITAAGLQFGDMNIFHYIVGNETLFSLSSATEPGTFDLDRIGEFSCSGLTLFANLREVSNPKKAFEVMLRCAEQLADDLNGELRSGTRRPWNEEAYQQLHQKVMQY